jgi:hypothetical protein
MCVAVGALLASGYSTVIEMWDGVSWSIAASPNAGSRDLLYGVSCATLTKCVAVGDDDTFTLTEFWDGSVWHIQPSPTPGMNGSYLNNVACADAKDCVAVGGTPPAGTSSATLILTWQSTQWSVTSSPNKGTSTGLSAVACPGTTTCRAVGAYAKNGLSYPLILMETGPANRT